MQCVAHKAEQINTHVPTSLTKAILRKQVNSLEMLYICYSLVILNYSSSILYKTYHKRRKFRGVINFVVFADATIPQNLIRWV